jgi:hypothetical protein
VNSKKYEKILEMVADKLKSEDIVLEFGSNLALGITEVSNEVIKIMKERYDLPKIECSTCEELDWEYYIFNNDEMNFDEAKKYSIIMRNNRNKYSENIK